MSKLVLESVTIVHVMDNDPDLSWLGTFSQKPEDGAIDHEPGNNRTFIYFSPGNGDPEHPEYAQQDYETMLAYERQNWWMVGIKATAQVSYECEHGTRRLQDFESYSLWGNEKGMSNDESHLREVEEDQLYDLRKHLVQFGVPVPAGPLQADFRVDEFGRKEDLREAM